MTQPYTLYTAPGSGGMIVEAAFAKAEIPLKIIEVDWQDLGWHSKALAELNPLGQIPTVVLPEGKVMTETAAIIQHIADLCPDCGLVPPPTHPMRSEYLRWLTFLVSAVYPTFTYGDVPTRWVGGDEDAAEKLRQATDEHRRTLYIYLETFCGAPWFLGKTFSAIDLYFWLMRHWRPKPEWFAENCPRLNAVSLRVEELTFVQKVSQRNFPQG